MASDAFIDDPWIEGIEKEFSGGRFRTYDPLKDEPGLFLDFAYLDQGDPKRTADAIVAFCNRYGPLDLESLAGLVAAERCSDWMREIERLRHAVDVWDAIRTENLDKLKALGAWDGSPLPQNEPERLDADREESGREGQDFNLREWIMDCAAGTQLDQLNSGGPPWAARAYLAWITDKMLTRYIDVRFAGKDIELDDPRPFEIRHVPKNLRGCIWLQFADYLSRPREFRRCDICGKWTPSGGTEGVRNTRRYCSDACRNISHYKKSTVLELRARGKSVAKIVEQSGIRDEVVRRWIEESKEREKAAKSEVLPNEATKRRR